MCRSGLNGPLVFPPPEQSFSHVKTHRWGEQLSLGIVLFPLPFCVLSPEAHSGGYRGGGILFRLQTIFAEEADEGLCCWLEMGFLYSWSSHRWFGGMPVPLHS